MVTPDLEQRILPDFKARILEGVEKIGNHPTPNARRLLTEVLSLSPVIQGSLKKFQENINTEAKSDGIAAITDPVIVGILSAIGRREIPASVTSTDVNYLYFREGYLVHKLLNGRIDEFFSALSCRPSGRDFFTPYLPMMQKVREAASEAINRTIYKPSWLQRVVSGYEEKPYKPFFEDPYYLNRLDRSMKDYGFKVKYRRN